MFIQIRLLDVGAMLFQNVIWKNDLMMHVKEQEDW
jgi:hypothetical protein